jgi:hypothetical protein
MGAVSAISRYRNPAARACWWVELTSTPSL